MALGRILQVIGWLWFIAGFVGPMFDFDSLNPFPGLVLVFIARIFRARARSEMPPGPGGVAGESPPVPVETPRPQPRQQIPPPTPKRVQAPPTEEPKPDSKPERPVDERNQLLERIAMAGREASDEPDAPKPETKVGLSKEDDSKPSDMVRTPMSSADMIAQARKRWDRNKR